MVRTETRRSRGPEWAIQLLCLFGLLLGASMAVLAPATMTAADRVLPELSHLAHLLGRELEMMAPALLPPAVSHLAPPGRWEARRVTHLRATAAVLTVCPLLFLAAGADLSGGRVVADGPGRLALAAFGLVFTCFSLWCLWGFTPQVHRYARDLPPGPLRTGLRLITAGAVLGGLWGLWGLWGLAGVGNVMLHQGQGAGQDPVAVALGTGCLAVSSLGVTAARWAPAGPAVRRWWRSVRGYRALEPLWSSLYAVVPQTALEVRPGRGPGALLVRDAELALYRRVIEIRDGYLTLRPHFPPHFPHWAEEGFRRFPVAPSGAAAATEAAAVVAALESLRSGRRPGDGPDAPAVLPVAPVQGTVDAEVVWLTQVTRELTRSEAVAYVRRRARLAAGERQESP
ncbi:MAB_1171c family putative transporter [Streptomyces jumonjinensis]|uniref:MAB_1171c family putative transporter n=1 Tax=Streptomyces jumonjinensis TaxID=1945 RepID=UPI00331B075D